MSNPKIKPIKRSALRIKLGTIYFILKRYLMWILDGNSYAKDFQSDLFPYVIFRHQTTLLRKLKNVDMWYQKNKIKNLEIAISKLNGIILYPGETFSYWKLIGKPTKKKGYVEGMVLYYGHFIPGIGGGLCQLSNLIYWMTLHTPLKVVERHRHSYDVFPDSNRTQPFGSGATCAYNYLDLQIRNTTNQPFQLNLSLSNTHLIGEWRTIEPANQYYEVYEKDHAITQAFWGDFVRHNIIYRRVFNRRKQLIADEYVTENHAIMMYEPLIEQGQN